MILIINFRCAFAQRVWTNDDMEAFVKNVVVRGSDQIPRFDAQKTRRARTSRSWQTDAEADSSEHQNKDKMAHILRRPVRDQPPGLLGHVAS